MSKDPGLEVFAVNNEVLRRYLAHGEADEVHLAAMTPSAVHDRRMIEIAVDAFDRLHFALTWQRAFGTCLNELWLMWDGHVMLMLRPAGARMLHLCAGDTVDLKLQVRV
jgi:hypothetical protein